MVRPPKEQVDEIVDAHRQGGFVTAADADVLAAEVLALRKELRTTQENWYASNRELSRLEAAPCYSTEAVDAVLCFYDNFDEEAEEWSEVNGEEEWVRLIEAMRASREPKL